ncbi:MAG: autotransporter outer membrane beta-barrel domain-containing protein [Puniceicoccaceae bacterium]
MTINLNSSSQTVTAGEGAHAVLVQAIAGGGGSAGKGSGAVGLGGDSSAGGNGGEINVNGSGLVTTLGENAIGVLSQSIAGGGGNGGSAGGVITVGSDGASGGTGGEISIRVGNDPWTIVTAGQLAHGIVNQSIGGGGGNGGNATADGAEISVAVGGSGGAGGNGGTATVSGNRSLSVSTGGSNSAGIVNQSIAGGGGTGGSAYSHSVGVGFDAAVAVGGSGGSGGTGGTSKLDLTGTTVSTGELTGISDSNGPVLPANPVDSYGVVAQSIGGGGGHGGSATAGALAVAVPVPETDTEFAVSGSFGVGGTGGIGGTGGSTTVLLYNESTVTTQGQGSHGVIAQSIGGGGGLGGDSSASAATVDFGGAAENSVSVSGEFTMGGGGGGGADGGPVTVNIAADDDGDPAGTAAVTTYGDFANAVVAQSVGGGGGNAGFGSGNTQNRGGTESISAGVNMGAAGGSGGAGKGVSITIAENGAIDTYGSGAHGIVAQSIGGGGGTSQGGSLSFGAAASLSGGDEEDEEDEDGNDEDLDLEGNVSISMGRAGGSGSEGGTVEIQNDGTITTRGGDAGGILAQSIGGGGGIGGGAGGDASADNPIDPSSGERRFPVGGSGNGDDGDDDDDSTSVSATFSMELGGGGGEAANGGTVSVGNSGTITTGGDFSTGILAQSIGGGGGKAGTAVAQDTDASPDLSVNVASGGSGGQAGNGGEVTFTLQDDSAITTAGYGAFGIHGQSIGGGGGIGVDGSGAGAGSDSNPGKISLGGDFSGNGGNGGSGGSVELDGSTTVTTTGDAAHGIVLQSIGGGGGVGGHGSSASFGAGSFDSTIQLAVGGGSGSSGGGGAVTLGGETVRITTGGWASSGIIAQSIGGGGGLAWTPSAGQNILNAPIALGGAGSSGAGESVSVTLGSGSGIQTSGLFSHGIVAQSIGGGGGIAGFPNVNSGLAFYKTGLQNQERSGTSSGNGAGVTVSVDGTITTTGDASHGIFAQSIGGGGGFRGYENSVDFGTGSSGGSSTAGNIKITQSGTINVSGEQSVGILAQQDSPGVSGTTVDATINGDVVGGPGSQGFGAWIISKSSNQSTLTIGSAGSLGAASGNAARFDANGSGGITLNNNGNLTGNIVNDGNPSDVQINNRGGGRFIAGESIQANVRNDGRMFVGHGIGGVRFGRTEIAGDFTQTSGGALIFRTDFERGQSDSLAVRGNAVLDGEVEPRPAPGSRILPNRRLTLVTVDGGISGDLRLVSDIRGIFEYDLGRFGNSFAIAAVGIDLEGIASGLTANQTEVARNLESIWLAGSGGLDVFGTFDAIARSDPGAVRNFFDELTPGATLGFAVRGPAEGQYFSDTALNGPIFEGETTRLAENPSAWLRAHGRTTSQRFGGDGFSNYRLDSMMYQTGGQKEIGEDLYIGGSIAYRDDSLSSRNNVSSGDGDTALAAITLKHEIGPWFLAGAVSGSLGWYDTTRRITFPGREGAAEGSPRVQTGALALRAAYTQAYKRIYLRPLLTLTGVHTNASGYTESGAGGFALRVEQADQTTLFATPAIEIGARSDFSNDWVLRSFARAGLDLASSDSWDQEARFVGAPDATGGFTTELPLDEVSGMVTAGFDLRFTETTSAHIRYEGKFSENVTTNGGSVGLKLAF